MISSLTSPFNLLNWLIIYYVTNCEGRFLMNKKEMAMIWLLYKGLIRGLSKGLVVVKGLLGSSKSLPLVIGNLFYSEFIYEYVY
jgi:hypothetical protein